LEAWVVNPKVIYRTSNVLHAYDNRALIDQYDVYNTSLLDEVIKDDIYVIAADGVSRLEQVKLLAKESKNNRKRYRKDVEGLDGLEGRLIPPSLLIAHYFAAEQNAIIDLNVKKEKKVKLQN
jgi:type I restriction enzyme M protein